MQFSAYFEGFSNRDRRYIIRRQPGIVRVEPICEKTGSNQDFELPQKLILASSSSFRRQLLDRLRLDYEARAPDIDESVLPRESAVQYVRRLAEAKAAEIAWQEPDAVVIGSDQCALLDGEILGKPVTHERALAQLIRAQGKTVVFHTGICVMQASSGFSAVAEEPYEVDFRRLRPDQLENYLRIEQPYDCAGSFKAEAYGITLFERMRGDDPTALIGLPLIRLIEMLEQAGVEVV